MKRKGYISPLIEMYENFEVAFYGFADKKHRRNEVKKFEQNLESNLQELRQYYIAETWQTSEYTFKDVSKPKKRKVAKLPIQDHVIQWAISNQIEDYLHKSMIKYSCSCVKGRGTHFFKQALERELKSNYNDTYYFVQLDIHHYFLNIDHNLMKSRYRRKIKDNKLLFFLDEFVDSFHQGLPLGVKISQMLANIFLAPFDWLAIECFKILQDQDKFNYWQDRYVTDKILTCRTQADADVLNKGVEYVKSLFKQYLNEGLRHYLRFADNIIILHRDKTFLHIIAQISIMILARDYLLQVNKNWNVRPVHAGGIDVCGYVFFHDHTALRKRNKQALCRQVAELKKKGLTDKEIQLKCASRVGFAQHADTRNLLKKLNMEKRLGKLIKNRKRKAPFEGMEFEQKQSIEDIICHVGEDENQKLILLMDYIVDDSVIEKNDDGTPKQRIALRYKCLNHIYGPEDNPTYEWGEEHYAFSGSKIMIEQAEQDFNREDLPSVTVIQEYVNKQRKKFYKFT